MTTEQVGQQESSYLKQAVEKARKALPPLFDRGGGPIDRHEIADACVRVTLSSARRDLEDRLDEAVRLPARDIDELRLRVLDLLVTPQHKEEDASGGGGRRIEVPVGEEVFKELDRKWSRPVEIAIKDGELLARDALQKDEGPSTPALSEDYPVDECDDPWSVTE
jgi:hypothetical protein